MEKNKNIVLRNTAEPNSFTQVAMRVSAVSIVGNVILSVCKLAAGILAHSGAMISDSVHSASDVVSTIVVIIGIRLSSKSPDHEHPYGHERMECVAAVVLAMILFLTGLAIGYSAVTNILFHSGSLTVPGILALVAAIVSIISKETMFWYTRQNALKIDSSALMADAWHHRSDALSSIGALVGIAGARLGFPILDPIASFVICLFIVKAAYSIFKDAVDKMVDHACDDATQHQFLDCALRQDGVLGVDVLRTRIFGSKIYVDMEIQADGNKPLKETHSIAEQVHNAIETEFPKVKHIMIHVNPREN